MSELIISMPVDYGYTELKRSYRKYMTRGLLFAAGLHILGIGSYIASQDDEAEKEPPTMIRIPYEILGPPPSIVKSPLLPIAITPPPVKPSVGIPVPVPPTEVDPGQTIPPQPEMNPDGGLPGVGTGEGITIADTPLEFEAVEIKPIAIKKVQPVYPEIARRAGIEGAVELKVWVDKEGKVRKAEIVKSSSDILNQPAVDAAMQWSFTPAFMKGGPVSVWVSIPFIFKLQVQ